jgi:hypothetical protein
MQNQGPELSNLTTQPTPPQVPPTIPLVFGTKRQVSSVGRRSIRGGRRPEERVLAERLEGEAPQEAGDAAAEPALVLGAVVLVHLDGEHGYAGDDDGGHEPRPPLAVLLALVPAVAVTVASPRRHAALPVAVARHGLLLSLSPVLSLSLPDAFGPPVQWSGS